jgi:hypothetical protein
MPRIGRTLILLVVAAVFVGPLVLGLGHLAHAAWGMALVNSLVIAISFTVLSTASAALAGFAFARHRVWWKNIVFLFVLSTLMVPWIVTMIPQFVVFYRLHLINTPWPWVLWGLQGTPLQIFLFRQFFASFPRELDAHHRRCRCLGVHPCLGRLPDAGPLLPARPERDPADADHRRTPLRHGGSAERAARPLRASPDPFLRVRAAVHHAERGEDRDQRLGRARPAIPQP